MPPRPPPTNFAVLLFPGFQLLDVAGPLDALNMLAYTHRLTLCQLASSLSPVSTHNASHQAQGSHMSQSLVPTHTFATAPSDILARTGVLHGRRATTNKRAFHSVKAAHPQVEWVAKARWVVDGHFWTSLGVSAGMDLAFAWIAEVYGDEVARAVAERSEYERRVDAGDDVFAERWGAV